jgi:endonuclease-3
MREDDIHPLMKTLRQASKCWGKSLAERHPSNKRDPFRVLISAMLSLHVRDTAVMKDAAEALLALARTPQAMLRLPPAEIQKAISTVDFASPTISHILQICKILVERYGGRVPNSREALMALPGIGPKTASHIVIEAFGQPAICVGMNVHRVTNRWGYVSTRSPERTEMVLRTKLPRDYWCEIGEHLGTLGAVFCLPEWPRCMACPVNTYCDRAGVGASR